MFSAIYESDVAQLMTLGRTIYSQDDNKLAALLCLDHTFRNMDRQTPITGSERQILNRTRALCEYAELVQLVLSVLEPWTKEDIQKLFSFTVHSGDRVCLRRGTYLHGFFERSRRQDLLNQDSMIEVRFFYNLYRNSLQQRLRERLDAYCNTSLSVRVFDPCEAFAFARCDRTECQRQHNLDHAWFDRRLQFHMFQISILDSLRALTGSVGPRQYRFDLFLFERMSSLTLYSEASG